MELDVCFKLRRGGKEAKDIACNTRANQTMHRHESHDIYTIPHNS